MTDALRIALTDGRTLWLYLDDDDQLRYRITDADGEPLDTGAAAADLTLARLKLWATDTLRDATRRAAASPPDA